MLTIKILGSGCVNCKKLEQMVSQVVEQLNIQAQVIKVTDPTKYVDYGLLATPGLVINEKLVSSGRVPSLAEITSYITSTLT